MPAIASGHGVVSGSAAFWASCATAVPVIAADANSATVILACCMRFPSCVWPCPACAYLAYWRQTKLQGRKARALLHLPHRSRLLPTSVTLLSGRTLATARFGWGEVGPRQRAGRGVTALAPMLRRRHLLRRRHPTPDRLRRSDPPPSGSARLPRPSKKKSGQDVRTKCCSVTHPHDARIIS